MRKQRHKEIGELAQVFTDSGGAGIKIQAG
jgi:hypothetical protein